MDAGSTRLYNVLMGNPSRSAGNIIGRTAASVPDDNFFVKRGKSLENAFGTTGAAIAGAIDIANENQAIENRNKKFNQGLNDIYKEYGFDSADDYYNAKDAAEKEIFGKYGFDSEDYWNKHAELWNPAGTNADRVAALDATRQDVINRMSQEDADKIRSFDAIQDRFKSQSAANSEEARTAAKNWEDYRNNSYIGQKINQDPGKFAGSAINTLSTMTDVMLPGAGVALNAVQGGAEGIADELEQNGLQNFSWERAGQNAAAGAIGGAAAGAFNKSLNNALAKRGGNLFKGGNAVTRGINNLGSNTALGRGASTVATGIGRGAASGAVGGAAGGGTYAAMNNQDILSGALQGAQQGAQQGAFAGGAMAGANMALSRTPGVGNVMQKLNQAGEDWQNSGENFGERFNNTRLNNDTWGNRLINNTTDSAGAVKQGFKNVGEGLGVLAKQNLGKWVDEKYTDRINGGANKVNSLRQEKNDLLGRSGSPLAANQEGGVTQTSSLEGSTSLGDQRPGVSATPLGTRGSIAPQNAQNVNQVANVTSSKYRTVNPMNGERTDYTPSEPSVVTNAPETEVFRALSGDTANNARWDDIAKEYGFNNYNEAVREFAQKNPDTDTNAGNVIDWMESNLRSDAKTFTQAKTGKTIEGERAITEEIMNQFNPVNAPTVRQTKPGETFYNIYKNLGLSDGNQIRQAVHYAEPGQLIPTVIREAAGRAGVVDMTDARDIISGLGLKKQNYNKTLNIIEDIMDSTPSSISGGKSGVDALQLQRTIEAMASDAMGTSGDYHVGNNIVDQTTARNLLRASNSIGDKLDQAIADNNGVQYALNKYAPEIEKMRNEFPGNEKWQAWADGVANAETVRQLRSSIKDLTRASMFIEYGDNNYGSMGSRMARRGNDIPTSKSGVVNRVVNDIYEKVSNSPQARDVRLAKAERKIENESATTGQPKTAVFNTLLSRLGLNNKLNLGNAQAQTGDTAPTSEAKPTSTDNSATSVYDTLAGAFNNRAYNVIGREEGLNNAEQARTANYLADATNDIQEAEVVPNAGTTATYDTLYGGANTTNTQAQTTGGNSYFPETGDYWTDLLGRAMTKAIDADDVEAFAALYGMYQDAASKVSSNSNKTTAELNATQQAQLAKIDTADSAIDELEAMFENAGGGKGPILGGLQSIAGDWGWDSNAKTYNDLSEGLINQIAAAVGKTDALNTEGEVKRALKLVPQLTDDATTAKNKLEELRRMLSTTKANYNAAYGVTS